MGTEQRAKAEAFRALHHAPEILVLPNAWDVGSARVLADAEFPAIATTSGGVAYALGYPDGQRIPRDVMLEAVARIAAAVPVPVSADLEGGYGAAPERVAETVRLAIDAGAIGANLEDGSGRTDAPLLDFELAVERIRAARHSADSSGVPFVINARTDACLRRVGTEEEMFAESVRRANAYLASGADCAFVPGLGDGDRIARLARAIDGPLNVLAGPDTPPTRDLQALGVARVSIGGSLARAALRLVDRAARELRGPGTYGFAKDAFTARELNQRFAPK